MERTIVKIDRDLCNGCGLCARACHEGAIQMIDGKAVLTREDYCDGLGDCLPACPTGAITFEKREALPYDKEAVMAAQAAKKAASPCSGCCPGTAMKQMDSRSETAAPAGISRLSQWPVQLKLLPTVAPCFDGADLLVAADCAAFAHGNFHEEFIKGRAVVIGCPKLDMVDYTDKLTEIVSLNDIKSITVARMQVPCCGGIEMAARNALLISGKDIPIRVMIITPDGKSFEKQA